MFDTFFQAHFITKQPGNPHKDAFHTLYIFKFYHDKEPYIVRVEQFDYDVFAIKFYPKSLKRSPKKYNKLTNNGKQMAIFRTCINIMLHIIEEVPHASFGIMGAELIGESKESTKRFRIYRSLLEQFFSPVRFRHEVYPQNSVYLMYSTLNQEVDFRDKVEAYFMEIFDFQGKEEEGE